MNMLMMVNTYLASLKSEKGQGLAEYALIIVLVAIAVVAALTSLGTTVGGVFDSIVGNLTSIG